MVARNYFKSLGQDPNSEDVFPSLIWSDKMRNAAKCKNILLLFLGILSAVLTTDQLYTAELTCKWILDEADLFLIPVPALSFLELANVS